MSFQCHGPGLRTDITFAGASIHVGLACFSSPTVGAGRFDTYAESVSARTSLALPEGQTATPPACCKFSLPHPGKFAGSRHSAHYPMADRFDPTRSQYSPPRDRDRVYLRELRREGSSQLHWRLSNLSGHAAHGTGLAHVSPAAYRLTLGGLFRPHPVGELLFPFEGPIDEISYFASDLLPSILRTAIAAGVTLSALTVLSPYLTLVVIPLVPAFLAVRHRYRRRIGRQADLVQAARSKFSSFLQEHLSALTQIQLLRQTEPQENKASELLTNTVCSQDELCKTGAFFSAFSNLAVVSGIAATLTWGSLMVFRNKLTIGTLVAFYSLLVQLFDPLSMAMEMYSRAQRTFASIRQIQAVLGIAPAVKEHCEAKPLASDRALHVAFRDVSFVYQKRSEVIRIPNLEIFQGERIAIVGPNGSGKSTLAKLLARLYDVDSGGILIAGTDVRAMALASLRSSVCYLS